MSKFQRSWLLFKASVVGRIVDFRIPDRAKRYVLARTLNNTLELEGSATPALVAQTLVLLMQKP